MSACRKPIYLSWLNLRSRAVPCRAIPNPSPAQRRSRRFCGLHGDRVEMLLRRGINVMTLSSEAGIQHLGIFWMLKLDGPVPPGPGPEPGIPATFLRAGPEIAGELAEAMMLDN